MDDELVRVHEAIGDLSDRAVDLQRSLVAIPAISPVHGGEGELEKALFLARHLREREAFDEVLRIDAPDVRAKDGVRPNLVATCRGREPGPSLCLLCHTDVAPPGDLTRWQSDPYTLTVRDGDLVGRGAEDDHQGIVASLLAIEALRGAGLRPRHDVRLLLVAGAGTGHHFGLEHLLRTRAELLDGVGAAVVPSAGSTTGDRVQVAEKSVLWLRLRVEGRTCHASTPHRGVNALRAASDLVMRLDRLHDRFDLEDPLFDPPTSTFEPTRREGPTTPVNQVPAEEVLFLDARVLPGHDLDEVLAEVRARAAEVARVREASIEVEVVHEARAGAATPADAPLVAAVRAAVREVRGEGLAAGGIGWVTPATRLRCQGVPAVVYARGAGSAHGPNEVCRLEDLLDDARVLAALALAGVPGDGA